MEVSKPAHLRTGRYSRGFLPHVRVEGRPYFVTFRLEGTLPQEVLRQYQTERDALRAQAERDGYQLSWDEQQRLFELYSAKVEAYLDAGYGQCWLKDARLAELVCNALRFFDAKSPDLPTEKRSAGFPAGKWRGFPASQEPGKALNLPTEKSASRYELTAWVVMPNHVHVIVRPEGEHTLNKILQSWKGYTSREANKILNCTGQSFWDREYYDHVIRDDAEKARLTKYIHDNPIKAGLCERWEDWEWSSAHARWK